jgi:phosphoribosylformylglycinamidine synthase
MKAKIFIKYKEGILDPQGTVTNNALKSIGIKGITSIGIGKFIEMNFDDKTTKNNAIKLAEESCQKLLANPNTETFSFEIEE